MRTIIQEYTIYDILSDIHNNKYVLPSIQRQYIWSLQQIQALFDSIMLGYPISTFLFWNLTDFDIENNGYFYQLLREVTFDSTGNAKTDNNSPAIDSRILKNDSIAILDGQQRLTSLFLILFGKLKQLNKFGRAVSAAQIMDLYLDLSSGASYYEDEEEKEDEKESSTKNQNSYAKYNQTGYTFDFKFFSTTQDKGKWFRVRDIIDYKNKDSRQIKIETYVENLPTVFRENAIKIITILCERIFDDQVIYVSELSNCDLNEALDIFVRFNNGGTRLSKSDLVFSTIESRWPESRRKVDDFLISINNGRYKFDRDFIVRLALVLFGQAKEVTKTIVNDKIVRDLKENWNKLEYSIRILVNFINDDLGIVSDREIPSYISLIPIVYSIYGNNNELRNRDDVKKYLYRALFGGIFGKHTNQLLVKLKEIIEDNSFCINISQIADEISEFKFTDEKINNLVESEKSNTTQLILFLIGNDNSFSNRGLDEYHQDHIHAYGIFENSNNIPYLISNPDWEIWKNAMRNKLPNLQILKGKQNIQKGKKILTEWFGTEGAPTEREFRRELNLPDEISLELKDFESFYNYRKNALRDKLIKMLL